MPRSSPGGGILRYLRSSWQGWPIALSLSLAWTPVRAEDLPSPPKISPPRVVGYVQLRETWQDHLGLAATLNRARIGAEGGLPSRFSYRVLIELEAPASGRNPGTPSLRDAYIRWSSAPVSLWFGQFKTPFSREYITSITAIETADRATVVDTLATKRDIGVMADYAIGSLATLAFGVFNGEGQNANGNRDSTVLPIARATLRPIPQVTLGASGARYGPDSSRVGFEASFEERGYLARGEYIFQHRQGIAENDEGWFALLGARVMPWLQLIAKQEDFRRDFIGPARPMKASTLGANVDFPGGHSRLIVDWVARESGATLKRRDLVIGQLQVRF